MLPTKTLISAFALLTVCLASSAQAGSYFTFYSSPAPVIYRPTPVYYPSHHPQCRYHHGYYRDDHDYWRERREREWREHERHEWEERHREHWGYYR